MGDFRIKIEGVGGHGCDRRAKPGDALTPCGRIGCPDCQARQLVQALQLTGASVKVAEFTHWPADLPGYTVDGEVKDDILAMRRVKGDFGPKKF